MASSSPGSRRPRGGSGAKSARSPKSTASPRKAKSGSRKKKPAKGGRLFNKKLLLMLLCFGLGLSAGLGLFWYLTASPPPAAPAAVKAVPAASAAPARELYEEPASQELLQLDTAINSALSRAGIEPAQIKLWIDLKRQGEVSRLEVALNEQQKLEKTAAVLDRALGAASVRGKWQKQENFWHLDVYLGKQLTHQVNLRKQADAAQPLARKPRVVIMVDDVGLNPEGLNQLLGLQLELTFSVLPYAPNAHQVARKITGQGRELWLHLPMEPLGRHNPGPNALYSNMRDSELSKLTRQALQRVPGAVGVNNHMGSKFTQNVRALAGPLQVLKDHNLMFLDSVTSPKSIAARQAREIGLTTGQRDIFLDHEVKEEAIVQQIGKLILLAKSKGTAIAICHPHPATIAALKQTKPLLMQMVELVPASLLLEQL